jgi:peptide/nickel transport system permease protein
MRRSSTFAWLVIMFWLVAALATPLHSDRVNAIDLERILEAPSLGAGLGFDDLGRSLGARVGAGARLSFLVAVVVVTITSIVGILVGVLAGWFGGWFDLVVIRVIDVFLAFPGILLAIALSGILGPGIFNLVLALAVVGWVGFARLTRAQTLSVRQRDHVLVAIALGASTPRIVLRHLLPLIAGPLIVEATFALASVIVAEAGLSFLGLGVQAPLPSWGSMIRDGTRYMLIAPHFVMVPGLALMSVVIAINVLGDRMRGRWQVRPD